MKKGTHISKVLSVLVMLAFATTAFAQKVTYHLPKQISNEKVRLTFQKVSASSSSYYVNYKAENIGDGVLIIYRGQTILEQEGGQLYPTSDTYILKSGENKTIYNQFRVKAPVKANAPLLSLQLNGLTYAMPSKALLTEKLLLAEKATQTIGSFQVKVMEYKVYSDRVYVNMKCTFNGGIHTVGNIDLSKLNVSGGKAEIVKKGDVVLSGKSYSFSINITPNGEELSVNFNDVLSESGLQKVELGEVQIKSTTYVERTETGKPIENTKEKEVVKAAELTFADFTALKKDIEVEMNNGGKPVEMAHEFLMEKGVISTAQIIDILSVFNLDGLRLKFAKMAYPFTSDKVKYHAVVGKLSYTKNKQALEEFLENK